MAESFVIADNIKWWIHDRIPAPICRVHNMRLRPVLDAHVALPNYVQSNSRTLTCEEGGHDYPIPRSFYKEKLYVIDKMDAKIFAGHKFINLDDEALPIAKAVIPKDSEYFVKAILTQSKVGLRLVVYAGKRGSNQKSQIFIEPEIKRLAFDQSDLDPNDVFTKLEAIFRDGTKMSREKPES